MNRTLCFTVDIGRDGFCVEMLRVLEPGTEVQGSFEAGGHEFRFRGEVCWAYAGAPYLGIRGKMGVRFTDEPRSAAPISDAPLHGT